MKSWSKSFRDRVEARRWRVRHAVKYASLEQLRRMAERGELGPRHYYAGLDIRGRAPGA